MNFGKHSHTLCDMGLNVFMGSTFLFFPLVGCDIHKASRCRADIFRNAKFNNRAQFCAEYVSIEISSKCFVNLTI